MLISFLLVFLSSLSAFGVNPPRCEIVLAANASLAKPAGQDTDDPRLPRLLDANTNVVRAIRVNDKVILRRSPFSAVRGFSGRVIGLGNDLDRPERLVIGLYQGVAVNRIIGIYADEVSPNDSFIEREIPETEYERFESELVFPVGSPTSPFRRRVEIGDRININFFDVEFFVGAYVVHISSEPEPVTGNTISVLRPEHLSYFDRSRLVYDKRIFMNVVFRDRSFLWGSPNSPLLSIDPRAFLKRENIAALPSPASKALTSSDIIDLELDADGAYAPR